MQSSPMMQMPKFSLPGARPFLSFRKRDKSFDHTKELAVKGR
jgi:hypothetical protein